MDERPTPALREPSGLRPPASGLQPHAWLLVGLLCATATASYLCRVNVSVAGALLMGEFRLSQIEMGRVFSAFLLGYALFQVPAGALADRLGARRVLAGAALAWVGVTALTALVGRGPMNLSPAATLWTLLILRFVLGVFEAPTFPAAGRGVASWIAPERQGRANGIVVAGVGLGSAIAPPLVSHVMIPWGWRTAMLVSAIPAMAVAVLWLSPWSRASSPPAAAVVQGQEAARPGNGRLTSGSFVLLTASYTLQGYVGYIFVFWFYLYLVQVRHFDLLRGALLGSLPWVLSIVSIPLGGIVSDRLSASFGLRWGRRAVPLAGLTLAGVFLAFGARTSNAYLAAVSLAFATAFVECVEGPFWATMMEIAGEKSGTAGGIMNMGTNVGGLVSPALTPVLAAHFGWENALYVAVAISAAAAAMWLGISPGAESGVPSAKSETRCQGRAG
jgi:ACS family glucarate transporter-like MFS transporter